MMIRPFEPSDEFAVIALWEICGITRPWNPPARDIAEKQKVQPELFLVAEYEGKIIGTIMGAYDGHRGVINYLAIHPHYQNQGHAKILLDEIERQLKAMGCPKINLMIRTDNMDVKNWYETRGYKEQDCIVLGKWLD